MKFKRKEITKNQWGWFGIIVAIFAGILIYTNINSVPQVQIQGNLPLYQFGNTLPQTSPAVPIVPQQMQPAVQQPVQQPVQSLAPAATARAVQEAMNAAVASIRPAIVAITVPTKKVVNPDPNPTGLALVQPHDTGNTVTGSGVIIDPAGYILTTFQTVGKAEEVHVKLFSALQKQYIAEVIAVDTTTDLVLLKIETPGVYPSAKLGNSDAIEVGDIVFAIGTPYGFSRSVSMGIISTNRRKIAIEGRWYPDLIQTDAAINQGDDGGALINIRGEVIGINMAYFIPGNHFTGIGFALPINDVSTLLGRI
jgi:S1-C subfamily serine protease